MYQENSRLKLELQSRDLEIQRLTADIEMQEPLHLNVETSTILDSVRNKVMPQNGGKCDCPFDRTKCFSTWLQDTMCFNSDSADVLNPFSKTLGDFKPSQCAAGRRVQALKESMDAIKREVPRRDNSQWSGSASSQSNSSSIVERAFNLFLSSLFMSLKYLCNNVSVYELRDVDCRNIDIEAIEDKLVISKKLLSHLEETCQEARNLQNKLDGTMQHPAQTVKPSCISDHKKEAKALEYELPTPLQEVVKEREEKRVWVEELLTINEELLELLQGSENKLCSLTTKMQTICSRNKELAEEIARLSKMLAGQQKAWRTLKEEEVGLRSMNEILKLKLACTEYELVRQELTLERLSWHGDESASLEEVDEAGSRKNKEEEERWRQAQKCIDEVEEIVLCMKEEVSKAFKGMPLTIIEPR